MKRGPDCEHVTDAAMTWEQIGRELGISKKAAFMRYRNAMKKLRKHPELIRKLRELAQSKEVPNL